MKKNYLIRQGLGLALAVSMVGSMMGCSQEKPNPSQPSDPASVTTAATTPGKPTTPAKTEPTVPADTTHETQNVETENPVETEDPVNTNDPIDNPHVFDVGLDDMRTEMEAAGAIAGIVYLGYTDSVLGDADFFDSLENRDALERYPFIEDIGFDTYAKVDGGHVFCIVPFDPAGTVEVRAWDMDSDTVGDRLLYAKFGIPVLIQGNVSDIIPNLCVTITNGWGELVDHYRPCLSLRGDGVLTPEEGPLVLDLTNHGGFVDPVDPIPDDAAESLAQIRNAMEPSAAVAGVIYLGYTDSMLGDSDFFDNLDNQSALEEYAFIREIDYDHYVKNDGGEVYCIVPADPDAVVEVMTWNLDEDIPETTVYQRMSGEPILIQGNASDIMPNLAVCIQDNFNNQLYYYRPHLSLQDGTVATPYDGPLVLDMSN